MDWDLKLPWDLSELDQNVGPNMGSMAGSSSELSTQGGSSRRLDCSVDLKLGGFGDSRSGERWRDRERASIAAVSPSKRPRAQSGGSQKVSCLVDGCKADLTKCREYHRKHKVCEVHSKTRIVMVAAQEQRFCQQCSRFHALAEFDEEKRSCRKRLDGHNRRRRKPQPVSISSAGLLTNYQGSRSSSYFQMFPTAMAWPAMKTEDEQPYNSHQPIHVLDFQQQRFSSSFSRDLKDEKHFPFLQDSNQPLHNTISFAESNNNNNNRSSKVLSDCALSLLSSPLQTSAINDGRIVPTVDRIRVGQPSLLSYSGGLVVDRYSSSRQGSNGVSVASTGFSCLGMDNNAFVSDASDPEMSCPGFSLGGEGSSDGGSQALPFTW